MVFKVSALLISRIRIASLADPTRIRESRGSDFQSRGSDSLISRIRLPDPLWARACRGVELTIQTFCEYLKSLTDPAPPIFPPGASARSFARNLRRSWSFTVPFYPPFLFPFAPFRFPLASFDKIHLRVGSSSGSAGFAKRKQLLIPCVKRLTLSIFFSILCIFC